ncbi:MAG: von Willebrand factor type A domain-containing protein, partial [Verrucomicrobiia bacterium]
MSDSTENTSKPSREQLEARVVAMLLGEARPFEEEQLREQLKTDVDLAKFCTEIEKTLPLLNGALDVGQALKAKSPKQRLAGKRRGKLKLLFRSDTGLPKRRIFRMDFRKALAIAAAVCVVLFIAAGLLLPNLIKAGSNAERISDNQTKSNSSFKRGSAVAGVDFFADHGVQDREDSLSIGESLEPIDDDKERFTAATATDPMQGLGLGEVSGKKVADGLVVESRTESTRSRGRVLKSSGRGLADIALPELKSDDLAASSDNYANFGTVPGGGGKTEWEGLTRSLAESESVKIEEAVKPGSSKQKYLATQFPQPAIPPVPMFESGYSELVNESTPQPSDGENLYWFKRETNSGVAPVAISGILSNGLVSANGPVPSTEAATKFGTTTFSNGSLYSISKAKPKQTVEKFKRLKVSGQEVPPIPQTGVKGVAVDGRENNWQFGYAYKSGVDPSANASMRGQALPNWGIPVPDEAAKQQWGVTRGDNTTAENRKQPSPFGDTAGMAGYGGMGGRGGMPGGMGGGGSGSGGAPESVVAGQPMGFVGVPVAAFTGGVVETFTLSVDKDGNDRIDTNKKLSEVAQGQAANGLSKGFGKQNNRRFAGRSTVASTGGELAELGQAVRFAAPVEVQGKPVSELRVRGFAEDKSLQLGKVVERDQSGAKALYFQSELSRVEAGTPERGAVALGVVLDDKVAKESGQAEVTTLGDVPALGRMFNRRAEPEKAARDLPAVQLERSVDTKAPSERGRTSGESVRQSLSLAMQDKDVLAESPVEEDELLTTAIAEALPALGSEQQQWLAEKNADKSRKSPAMRQPKSSATANRELRRRKGKPVANKKLPAPAPKPQSASRSSRLPEAKREEKQLVEKLKEEALPAKPPTPSVVYTPRPETVTVQNNFSTFSLNVSDVSFKTTLASLQAGKLPEPGDVRSEEFLNALEYRDPMPRPGEPLAFHWERARSPFTHDRDIIRFSVRTAALGRQPGRAINLVCLLDNSGSMEREDRVSIVQQALGVLARKLTPNDRVSLVTFSRT